jgi:hypothetical protein
MKKSDYMINCADAEACSLDRRRWEAARGRKPSFADVYDIRFDQDEIQQLSEGVKNPRLRDLVRAIPELGRWDEFEAECTDCGVFVGYVRRLLLHGRGVPYFVELKDIEAEHYDHEEGWFGFHARMPNHPEGKAGFRSPYQPYIPGRIVHIAYLRFKPADYLGSLEFLQPLRIGIEEGIDCAMP